MYIELTPEQRHLQAELRQYFATLISTEEAKEMEVDRHGKAYRAIIKRMGSDGKLGVGWPKEYGGLGFGPIEQQIFVNEAARADVPLPAVTLQTVGPTLMVCGTDAQKKKFLPAILAGLRITTVSTIALLTVGGVIKHVAEVEQTCSHVVVMHRGRVVAAGTVADVAGRGGVQLVVDDPEHAGAVLAAAGISASTVPARRALEEVFLGLVEDVDPTGGPR